jgi:acetylornithine deacetylase/succinyl-diaminopimelate desuccinylase-like protein
MPAPAYLTQHQNRFLEELIDWLRIPSVSADPKFHGDVLRAADYLKIKLEEAGAQNVELCPTAGNPIVYGEYFAGPDRPTVLVYGHYDVQPADPYELWTSPPFEPVIKDEKIYARGACDDKGQVYMHVKALEMMLRDSGAGAPCNIKFMFEGEEEVGSNNLAIFVRENKEKLQADVILISDTGILANDVPSTRASTAAP